MTDAPFTPDDWFTLITDTVDQSGHASEVQTGMETTPQGWRVFVTPVRAAVPVEPPAAGS